MPEVVQLATVATMTVVVAAGVVVAGVAVVSSGLAAVVVGKEGALMAVEAMPEAAIPEALACALQVSRTEARRKIQLKRTND